MTADLWQRVLTPVTLLVGCLRLGPSPRRKSAKVTPVAAERLYQETYRPQFHFTPQQNWTNDPTGWSTTRASTTCSSSTIPPDQLGNMTWGHAVSRDLVHWEQLDTPFVPIRWGRSSPARPWSMSATPPGSRPARRR